jgi:ABC-2 type transport system ATP-binding protein
MSHEIICVNGLVRHFGKTKALDGLTFSVSQGEIFGFLGPNGAGKTTTIRALLGLCRTEKGKAEILGYDISQAFEQIGPHLGIVLEDCALYDNLTAWENLDYHARLYDLPAGHRKRRCLDLIEVVGLKDRLASRAKTFSKGMKQRLALARALVNDPAILLLDEPFDGVDTETRRDLRDFIANLAHQEGKTIFLTSHNLPDVEKLATRVAIIQKGRVVACDRMDRIQGTMNDRVIEFGMARLVQRDEVIAALGLLGLTDSNVTIENHCIRVRVNDSLPLESIVERMVLAHLPVQTVTLQNKSLEDSYFDVLRSRITSDGRQEQLS